jgi:acetyl/propionyl-CoA carboxylase alpha subunit
MNSPAGAYRRFLAQAGNDDIDVDIDVGKWPEVRAAISGEVFQLRFFEVASGVYWFTLDGRSLEARLVPDGGGYRVQIGTASLHVRLMDPRRRLRAGSSGESRSRAGIRAPMPGRVVRVLAQEGARVNAGQGVLVLEAMKMQNEIKCPFEGTVAKIHVGEGVSVSAGDILVTVEADA